MPSLLIHIFVPLMILLAFSRELKIPRKMIILLSIFSILPDVDMILLHRYTLHNIFILFIPIFIYYFYRNLYVYGIITYYLASHLILDMFNGGTSLLYPFYDKMIYLMFGIEYPFDVITEIIINKGISIKKINMAVVSSVDVGIIFLMLIVFFISLIKKRKYLNISK